MASKGVTKRHFCAAVQRTGSRRGMPPRVFCEKSAQSIENKGREVEKERQERSRVRKRLEVREIEEGEEVKEFGSGALLRRGADETKLGRVFTTYDRIDYRSGQYIKWVLVFRDWAQNLGQSAEPRRDPHATTAYGVPGKSICRPPRRYLTEQASSDIAQTYRRGEGGATICSFRPQR